jgi:hypothetical protein
MRWRRRATRREVHLPTNASRVGAGRRRAITIFRWWLPPRRIRWSSRDFAGIVDDSAEEEVLRLVVRGRAPHQPAHRHAAAAGEHRADFASVVAQPAPALPSSPVKHRVAGLEIAERPVQLQKYSTPSTKTRRSCLGPRDAIVTLVDPGEGSARPR